MHEPVGSKALQESINSSSATIPTWRLEKQGLLEGSYLKWSHAKCCWFFSTMKHSLDFDRLAENEVYEIVKAFDQGILQIGDILQEAVIY